MKFIIAVTTFSLFVYSCAEAQVLSLSKFVLPEYCRPDSANSKSLIGRLVMIKNWGGIFEDLNTDKSFKWPSEEVRLKAGKSGWGNYKPKTGDTGTVVSVFYKKDENERTKFVYLLKIRENYVPISCFDVTDIDKADDDHYIESELIKNADYAKDGCKFKMFSVNSNYSNAGNSKIDSLCEDYACKLLSNGHDTVILCKGYPEIKYAFVLWNHDGNGRVVVFAQQKQNEVIQSDPKPFQLDSILAYFHENKLDTITLAFKPKLQALMPDVGGLSIQLAYNKTFFRGDMPILLFRAYKNEPEAIWWKMIYEHLVVFAKD
jgi:hypothetical protein